ncbi:MAG: DUF2062 domain-containing protein [SAR324 cluster bacterium]|nr:DUF2062 domain-containing protein [SAR324 cluster bacterium]
MKTLYSILYDRLIFPVINNVAPVQQVSWGVAIGIFIGLTPSMGAQMYIVAGIWAVFRYLFRLHFYLPVGVALVWVTNPVTVVPIYYLFLITGNLFFEMIDGPTIALGWPSFQQKFEELFQLDLWGKLVEGSQFLFIDLGLPMLIGSLFYAIPFAIIFYFVTCYFLTRYRQFKAKQANMTYEEWRLQHETLN